MMIAVVIILLVFCAILVLRIVSMKGDIERMRRKSYVSKAFIENMSHEVRTYLHSISGLAEIIAKEDVYLSKGEKKDISNQILFNTNLVTTLFEELSMLYDSGQGHQLEKESFSPNTLCLRCMESNSSTQVKEGVSLTLKRELPDSYLLNSDPHIVELILNKLLYNACRFTMKGVITIGCNTKEHEGSFTFYVQDTGDGFPEDRKNQLFNWFEHPTSSPDVVEFDLSIAQKLSNRIGGYLAIDERYTGGSRFFLVLPIR